MINTLGQLLVYSALRLALASGRIASEMRYHPGSAYANESHSWLRICQTTIRKYFQIALTLYQ